jgi:hypothetical protein
MYESLESIGNNGTNQVILIPEGSDKAKGIYLPSGVSTFIVFEQSNILSTNYYKFDLTQSIIPRLFYIEGSSLITANKTIEWRIYRNNLTLLAKQIISLQDFTVNPYGYAFNFPYPFPIPATLNESTQVYLKTNINLDKIRVVCEPCHVHTTYKSSAEILTAFPT